MDESVEVRRYLTQKLIRGTNPCRSSYSDIACTYAVHTAKLSLSDHFCCRLRVMSPGSRFSGAILRKEKFKKQCRLCNTWIFRRITELYESYTRQSYLCMQAG